MSKPHKAFKIVIDATSDEWLVEATQDVALTFEEMAERGVQIGAIRYEGPNYAWWIDCLDVDDDGV
jgi:hypothetical protein